MFFAFGVLVSVIIILLIISVYIKRPRYGIALSIITIILISVATLWSIYEPSLVKKAETRIKREELQFSEAKLEASYGNNFNYSAILKNNSSKYLLTSLDLQLKIQCIDNSKVCPESSRAKVKVWIAAGESKQIDVYFKTNNIAKEVEIKDWQLFVNSSYAK